MKTLLILLDGMRPDALDGIPFIDEMKKTSSYSLNAQTVYPSVTLPCHMSLFHSVEPSRHGTTTNTYAPQVRPIRGLFEVLWSGRKSNAFFYNWEELRDIGIPSALNFSCFVSMGATTPKDSQDLEFSIFCDYMKKYAPDFSFLYLGLPDHAGHGHEWMSEEYLASVRESLEYVEQAVELFGEEYTVILTSDHGGHEYTHGTDMPEDMTIPVFFRGPDFEPGKVLENVNIMDIAPTVTKIMGVEPDPDWRGKPVI